MLQARSCILCHGWSFLSARGISVVRVGVIWAIVVVILAVWDVRRTFLVLRFSQFKKVTTIAEQRIF